jgi:hypothetical protein
MIGDPDGITDLEAVQVHSMYVACNTISLLK